MSRQKTIEQLRLVADILEKGLKWGYRHEYDTNGERIFSGEGMDVVRVFKNREYTVVLID